MTVGALVGGIVLALVAVLALRAWARGRREEEESITEAQARENAAALTTAILTSDPRDSKAP